MEILNSFDHRKDVLALVLANTSDDDLISQGILRTEITAVSSIFNVGSMHRTKIYLVAQVNRDISVKGVPLVFRVPGLSQIGFLYRALSHEVQPSARFFVSRSLATLPPSLLTAQYLPTLLVNLRAELTLLEPRITAFESGLPLLPSTGTNRRDIPSLYHIEACLRLLDSYLLGHWSSADPAGDECLIELSHMNGFASELMALCVASNFSEEEEEEDVGKPLRR